MCTYVYVCMRMQVCMRVYKRVYTRVYDAKEGNVNACTCTVNEVATASVYVCVYVYAHTYVCIYVHMDENTKINKDNRTNIKLN